MNTKIVIQTSTGGDDKFVTENLSYDQRGAYRYTPNIKEAVLFLSIDDAVRWIERVSFYNGQNDKTFSGDPRLMRVEEIPVLSTPLLRVLGPVE